VFALSGGAGIGVGIGIGIGAVVVLAYLVFYIAALWRVFVKAGHPGWAAIIPFYNIYVLLKVVGRPGWWLILWILWFIPIIPLIVWIIVALDLAKSFDRGIGFAFGLILLSFVFIPILGFGDSRYAGPYAAGPRAVDVY